MYGTSSHTEYGCLRHRHSFTGTWRARALYGHALPVTWFLFRASVGGDYHWNLSFPLIHFFSILLTHWHHFVTIWTTKSKSSNHQPPNQLALFPCVHCQNETSIAAIHNLMHEEWPWFECGNIPRRNINTGINDPRLKMYPQNVNSDM